LLFTSFAGVIRKPRNQFGILFWTVFRFISKAKYVSLIDEGLTPTKDEGTCLRRLSMFRKEVH